MKGVKVDIQTRKILRGMREEGYFLSELSQQFGISKSTISVICKGVTPKDQVAYTKRVRSSHLSSPNRLKGTKAMQLKYARIRQQARASARALWEEGLAQNHEFHVFLMAYWCEGDKNRNVVGFSNGDICLLRYAYRALNQLRGNNALVADVNCAKDAPLEELKHFWEEQFPLAKVNVRRVKDPRSKVSYNDPIKQQGIVRFRVCNAQLAEQIAEWISLLKQQCCTPSLALSLS